MFFLFNKPTLARSGEKGSIQALPNRFTPQVFPVNEVLGAQFPARYIEINNILHIRYTLLIVLGRYEVVAACHSVALSFFGIKFPIPNEICVSPDILGALINHIIYRLLIQEFPNQGVVLRGYLEKNGVDVYSSSRDIKTPPG